MRFISALFNPSLISQTQNIWSKLQCPSTVRLFFIPKTYEGNGIYISLSWFNSTIIIKCLSQSGSALDSGDTEMNLVKCGKINNCKVLYVQWEKCICTLQLRYKGESGQSHWRRDKGCFMLIQLKSSSISCGQRWKLSWIKIPYLKIFRLQR